MGRPAWVALKVLAVFMCGGMVMAAGLFLVSRVIPVQELALHVVMGVMVAVFTLMGIVASARYLFWTWRRERKH